MSWCKHILFSTDYGCSLYCSLSSLAPHFCVTHTSKRYELNTASKWPCMSVMTSHLSSTVRNSEIGNFFLFQLITENDHPYQSLSGWVGFVNHISPFLSLPFRLSDSAAISVMKSHLLPVWTTKKKKKELLSLRIVGEAAGGQTAAAAAAAAVAAVAFVRIGNPISGRSAKENLPKRTEKNDGRQESGTATKTRKVR